MRLKTTTSKKMGREGGIPCTAREKRRTTTVRKRTTSTHHPPSYYKKIHYVMLRHSKRTLLLGSFTSVQPTRSVHFFSHSSHVHQHYSIRVAVSAATAACKMAKHRCLDSNGPGHFQQLWQALGEITLHSRLTFPSTMSLDKAIRYTSSSSY